MNDVWDFKYRFIPRLIVILAVVPIVMIAGCTPALPQNGITTDGNVGIDPNLYPNQRIQGEPNDSFANPLEVILNDSGQGQLQGIINTPEDVDVYSLGQLFAGDRIVIEVGTPNSGLDVMLVIFDGGGRLVFESDDRNTGLNQFDPFINDVIRHDSLVYYLAIARAPLDFSLVTGTYEVFITVVPDGVVPATAGQTVLLDFDGGSITIPGDRTYSVGPFDTADISRSYTGMTDQVRSRIEATVVENFEGLDLRIRMVPGDALPPAGTFTTILFGGSNPEAYGISEAIDSYNNNQSDSAIIFTDMFTPGRFGRILTATELGTAIGNVATHEMG
ncbi:MAG: hypothetical protein JSV03_01060, partial [Planctomycetota bacterium]